MAPSAEYRLYYSGLPIACTKQVSGQRSLWYELTRLARLAGQHPLAGLNETPVERMHPLKADGPNIMRLLRARYTAHPARLHGCHLFHWPPPLSQGRSRFGCMQAAVQPGAGASSCAPPQTLGPTDSFTGSLAQPHKASHSLTRPHAAQQGRTQPHTASRAEASSQ